MVRTTKKAKQMKEMEVHIEAKMLNLDVTKVDLEMMMVFFISNVILCCLIVQIIEWWSSDFH